MGKRPLVRRRGRGGNQFRSTSTGKVGTKANYPRFALSEQHEGEIIDQGEEKQLKIKIELVADRPQNTILEFEWK